MIFCNSNLLLYNYAMKKNKSILLLLPLLFSITSCAINQNSSVTSINQNSSVTSIDANIFTINNNNNLTIDLNSSVKLEIECNYEYTFLVWDSSDSKIVAVDSNGLVTGLKEGTATITAINNGGKASIEVTVVDNTPVEFYLLDTSDRTIDSGESFEIEYYLSKNDQTPIWKSSDESVCSIDSTTVFGLKEGSATITGEVYNKSVSFNVIVNKTPEVSNFTIEIESNNLLITQSTYLTFSFENYSTYTPIYTILDDNNSIKIEDNKVTGLNPGITRIQAQIETYVSNILEVIVHTTDPYSSVNKDEFYANYTPAISYSDAKFRSEHYLMSGSLEDQVQEPTIDENRPMEEGKYVRNSSSYFADDGNTYYIVDKNGNKKQEIYKNGAYTTLQEVAAYVFAFGDIPSNYTSKKSGKPSTNYWGKYLRLNHSYFSCDVSKYPYEPVLPKAINVDTNGDLQYYEMDIGTTGTDCDPSYSATIYNNGQKITRGAARIVYARTKNGSIITDINDRYLFYTYNHYNDFQEYLNYENGWGEMFGNITGGGEISSKTNYNPTPYVEVVRKEFNPVS